MSAGRYRAWCFTLFVEEKKDYAELHENADGLRFGVWQLEMSPTTQRLHIQGYFEFDSAVRLGTLKRYLGESVHGESRRGSRDSAILYCRKEETRVLGPWTFGNQAVVRQGKRTDLDSVADLVQSGETMHNVVNEYPVQYIRYRRGIEALMSFRMQQRAKEWRSLEVVVYYGDAGTGKTRKAIEDNPENFILDQGDRVWFDGYTGEPCLIIDDFYGWIKYGQLLRILDGHPLRLEVKGGFTWALWTKVIITSNKEWEDWYPNVTNSQQIAALRRRITNSINFPSN